MIYIKKSATKMVKDMFLKRNKYVEDPDREYPIHCRVCYKIYDYAKEPLPRGATCFCSECKEKYSPEALEFYVGMTDGNGQGKILEVVMELMTKVKQLEEK